MEERYKENNYENAIIALFHEMGYKTVNGSDVHRYDYSIPIDLDSFNRYLQTVSNEYNDELLDETRRLIISLDEGSVIATNRKFCDMLVNGAEVNYLDKSGELQTEIVRLIDYENVKANEFQLVRQWNVCGNQNRRMDLVVMINGLPLAVIELKSPTNPNTTSHDAYLQLRNYIKDVPRLFYYNQMMIVSDMVTNKVGTLTSDEQRYIEWKSIDGEVLSKDLVDYSTFFKGIFLPNRLLNILQYFIFYQNSAKKDIKIMAGYHQYFAVNKAVNKTKDALLRRDGRIGVFWHTQGSGKSLSMVMYTKIINDQIPGATILVLTDRLDLDQQLYETFCNCSNYLRQIPLHAQNGEQLTEILRNRKAHGIIFANIQKFRESDEVMSERDDLIVITDEAHRGHYGLDEFWDKKKKKLSIGTAGQIRRALPNASFIGFTGTPISDKDRNTRIVFGEYIDIYDMTQAVDDGATVPIYYESRIVKLNLDQDIKEKLDVEYESLAQEVADEEVIEQSKHELSRLEEILGAPETIDSLCRDIIHHYEDARKQELSGKAMIVSFSRQIGINIYQKMLELRPGWKEKLGVVMSTSNQDPESWKEIIGDSKEMSRRFKDEKTNDPLKIVIVKDMWLTGFDVPSLATMYVYKPMKGHNLMQAISRVNRVFPGKAGGLIVDYIGVASALKKAMRDYTQRDQKRFGDPNISQTAYNEFTEHRHICRDLLYGYTYVNFYDANDNERGRLIAGAVNFLMQPGREAKMREFKKHATIMQNSVTLCRSILNVRERYEAAYYDAIRGVLMTMADSNKRISKIEINQRITDLLKQSVKSEGVVNLFDNNKEEFSLFDKKFMEEILKMKEKNIAIELLKRLLRERISNYKNRNVVEAKRFSEMLEKSLGNYIRGMLTNEEVIKELLDMAKMINEQEQFRNEMGLTTEEKAFYDALSRPQAVKDFYSNEDLIKMTKELTETLKENRTLDWREKETARAKMRSIVKRLLKKYKYPPEEAQGAMDTVMDQCNQWSSNSD